jgi:hypothetical protein
VLSAVTYFDTGDTSLVSADRRATVVLLNITDDDAAGGVIDEVDRANADPDFAAAITGSTTRDHDFSELSERDLQNGELKFGLAAALIILLLVFGMVVAGLVRLLMAIVAITTALGLVALVTQLFELSIFTTNMLTGMGLALGIDYALFLISRYREERGRGRAPSPAGPPPRPARTGARSTRCAREPAPSPTAGCRSAPCVPGAGAPPWSRLASRASKPADADSSMPAAAAPTPPAATAAACSPPVPLARRTTPRQPSTPAPAGPAAPG